MLRLKRTTAHTKLTVRQVLQLLGGHDWSFLDDVPALTEAQLRTAWQVHGDALLHDLWLGRCQLYGTRPWAWWEYEAPEHRKMVAYGPTKDAGLKTFLKDCDRRHGLPSNSRGITSYETFCAWQEAFYETQAAYLARLGLLTTEEQASDMPYYARVQLMDAHDDCCDPSLEQVMAWLEER